MSGLCEKCPAFTKVSNSGRSCSSDDCNAREKLLENGSCETCPPYHEIRSYDRT